MDLFELFLIFFKPGISSINPLLWFALDGSLRDYLGLLDRIFVQLLIWHSGVVINGQILSSCLLLVNFTTLQNLVLHYSWGPNCQRIFLFALLGFSQHIENLLIRLVCHFVWPWSVINVVIRGSMDPTLDGRHILVIRAEKFIILSSYLSIMQILYWAHINNLSCSLTWSTHLICLYIFYKIKYLIAILKI